MKNALIGTIIQILVFTSVPFFIYIIKKKPAKRFFEYIGLKQSTKKANLWAVVSCLLIAAPVLILTVTSSEFKEIMIDPNSITGQFRQSGFGINTLTILLITALFKTALAEEILFRGFIAKRLTSFLGFVKGNLTQAAIFGILHAALFASITQNPVFLLIIFLMPAIGAYINVYLNEQLANGSIIPSWISHGLANVLAYSFVAFVI